MINTYYLHTIGLESGLGLVTCNNTHCAVITKIITCNRDTKIKSTRFFHQL